MSINRVQCVRAIGVVDARQMRSGASGRARSRRAQVRSRDISVETARYEGGFVVPPRFPGRFDHHLHPQSTRNQPSERQQAYVQSYRDPSTAKADFHLALDLLSTSPNTNMSTSTTQPTAEAAAGTSENPITVDSSAGTKRGREPETEAAPAGDAADQPKIDAALQAGEPAEEVAKENGAAAGHGEATEEAPSTKKRKVEAEEPAPAAQKGVRLCLLSCDRASRG